MRRFDKDKNIARANILAEQRYLESKGMVNELDKATYDSASEKARDSGMGGLADKLDAHSKERYGDGEIDTVADIPEENFSGSISFDIKYGETIKTLVLNNLVYGTRGLTTFFDGEDENGKNNRMIFQLHKSEFKPLPTLATFYQGNFWSMPSTINDGKNYLKLLNDNGIDTLGLKPKQITAGYASWGKI